MVGSGPVVTPVALLAMPLAIAVAFLSVALGIVLGLGHARARGALGAVRTFALVAAVATVALELLPGSAARGGLGALATFAVAATLPWLLEVLGARFGAARSPALRLELGYLALLVHHVGDGLGMGAYATESHHGHVHWDVLLSIGGHTVPVTAVVVLAFSRTARRSLAAARGVGFAVAIVVGIVLATSIPVDAFARVEPHVTAAVAGLLLHVATHDWLEDLPQGGGARLVDLIAAGAGVALVVASASSHDHDAATAQGGPEDVVAAAGRILLRYAPALLAAAVLGGLLGRSAPPRVAPGDGALAALRAALLGATLGSGVERARSVAEGVAPGRPTAAAIALALGGAGIALETLAASANAFGPPFAGAWVALAVVVIAVVALVTRRRGAVAADAAAPDQLAARAEVRPRFFDALEDAVARSGAPLLMGVVAAAVLAVTLKEGALAPLSLRKLDVLALPLAAAALGAPPLALVAPLLVLVDKGANAPAALVALAVAAAMRRPLVAWAGAPLRAIAAGVAVACAVGFALTLARWPASPARVRPPASLDAIELACAVGLAALALAGMWRRGVRAWLAAGVGWQAHHHGPCFEESAGATHDHREAAQAVPRL